MPPRPDTIDLDRFLPYRLSVLTNLVSSTIADAYQRRFGLSIPEWRVLAVLARYPRLSAAEVAELTRRAERPDEVFHPPQRPPLPARVAAAVGR